MSPDDSAGAARVEALLGLHRWDDATRAVVQLLAAAPDDTALLMLLTRAHLGAERPKEALATAEAALATAPDNPQAHFWRTAALLDLDLSAVTSAGRAVELAPHNPQAWFLLSRAYTKSGQWELATDAANNILRIAPGQPLGHHALGLVHLQRREWELAEREYRTALALAPTNPDYLNNLGLARLHQGDAKAAVDHFVSAGELAPGDAGLIRRNVAAAGEAYIQRPHAKLRRNSGYAVGAVAFVLIIVFAVGGVAVGTAAVVGLVATYALLDRVRLRRLPSAARMAVQSRRRELRAVWRSPRQWTRRQWRLVTVVVLLLTVSIFLVLASNTPDRPSTPNVPTFVISPGQAPDDATCAAARAGVLVDKNGIPLTPADLGCPS